MLIWIPFALSILSAQSQYIETAMTDSTLLETPAETALYAEIPDESTLSFLNPDLKERKIAKIALPNGLQAYLISDPGADQSAASVAVMAGSWNDPEEYPGMAHFCEHMLFMGTEKYPDCNAFFNQVSDFGGSMNAFTAPDRTVYMFSAKVEGFLEILDRFSRFFIDPLFDPKHISRELHAVDQEYAKNLENDLWREYMVFKETCKESHPNRKFSTGNAATLGHIPASALRQWHQGHYGAGQMRLFLYSSLPIETLKQSAASLFGEVPSLENSPSIPHSPIASEQQRGHIAYITPIQNKQRITLTWELPPTLSIEPTRSAELIAYALSRGQEHSLHELLKKEQLIDGLSIRSDDLGMPQNGSFSITLELSPKGMANWEQVVQRCFEAIAGLKTSGIPSRLFDEKNAIAKLNYEYQSRQDAFRLAQSIGQSLPDEPLSTYPKASLLGSRYDAKTVQQILSELTPQSCCISVAASPSLTKITPDKKEKWLGAEYAIRPLSQEWIASLESIQPNSEISVADPNPYLPSRLDLVAADSGAETPLLLSETESGIAYYCRTPEFSTPEASLSLFISSPSMESSARSSALMALYIDHLTDELHPDLDAAQSAGLGAQFDSDKFKFSIQVYGYSDKAPLLLDRILRKLSLPPPTKEQFDLYISRHAKMYQNGAKELPFRQGKEMLDSVLANYRFTGEERLLALQSISYEDYLKFQKQLFAKTYSRALFSGNLTLQQAESSWIDIQHALSAGIYRKADHIQPRVLALPQEGGPFSLEKLTDVQGNAALLAIDEGDFSLEKRSAQEILAPALREAFFTELRTKQKTGYITGSEPTELEDRLFHILLVQSNSHEPKDLLYRFELFLEEYMHTLQEQITQERFQTLKASSIHSLQTRFRNLKDKSALWTLLAFEKGGDFQYLDKRIASLQALSYDRFVELTSQMLSRDNTRRLAVLCEGKVPRPFAYTPIDATRIQEIGQYLAKER